MHDLNKINENGQREYKSIVDEDIYKLKSVKDKKIDYIIDIGANIGLFSTYASKIFPNAKIIAIEPCRPIFECLLNNCGPNKNITILNCAFGKDGFCEIMLDENFHLGSRFKDKNKGKTKSLSLGSIFNIFNISGNYIIKSDCEGGEEFLVNDQTSEEIIKKSELTSLEIHFKTFNKSKKEYEKTQAFKNWEFYNDWIRSSFNETHVIDYYKSNKHIGYGHYSITKK